MLSSTTTRLTSRGPFLPLILTVAMLIVVQSTASWIRAPEKTPGKFRGDLEFLETVLPNALNGWTSRKFTKPKNESDRREHQTFSSHQWHFQDPTGIALISCDQSNWHDWHELTFCYHQTGWDILSRTIHSAEQEAPYVMVELKKQSTHAVLIFSMFYRDGLPLQPPDRTAEETLGTTVLGRWVGRGNEPWHQTHANPDMLALQCQVLFTTTQRIKQKQLDRIVQLHLETRKQLILDAIRQSAAGD